jgi:formiminotetrahydrofolate cyclodeaminase
VGAGTGLLEGALKAMLFNVDVNLPGLADTEMKVAWGEERASLATRGAALAEAVLKAVSGKLAGQA